MEEADIVVREAATAVIEVQVEECHPAEAIAEAEVLMAEVLMAAVLTAGVLTDTGLTADGITAGVLMTEGIMVQSRRNTHT